MSAWIRITLCDVPGMLDGAMEVEVRSESGGTGAMYYVGREEQHGQTVVRPVDTRGVAVGPDWEIDGSSLDALEAIQADAGCRHCAETGQVETASPLDLAMVTPVGCEDCDGKGWVQP